MPVTAVTPPAPWKYFRITPASFWYASEAVENQELPREKQLKQQSGNAEYWFVKVDKALVEACKPLENSGF
jgi:hypothetical protein